MLLDTVELDSASNPTHVVIWLHGLGADGNDFVPLVPELVQPDWPAIRFVFPHAPIRAVTINNGFQMRAWYDIADMDFAQRADMQGVRESIAQLDALIDEELARGVPLERIYIAGFSQGGAVALSWAVRSARQVAGIVALSTYLPAPEQAATEKQVDAHATPVFMAHGTQDPVVPCVEGERSAAWLQGHGFDVQWHAYPMQHQVAYEELVDLRNWWRARLGLAG